MRLLSVELRRFWSRRLFRLLVGATSVGIVIYGGFLFLSHSSEMPSVEQVQAEVDQFVASCRADAGREYESISEEIRSAGGEDQADEFLLRFPDVETFTEFQCDPSHFGVHVEEPRFCLVDLWERRSTYRDTCPDVVTGQGGPIGPDVSGDDDVHYRTVVGGKEYLTVREGNGGILPGVSLALLILSAVFGAAFIGSEYRAGTIETQLLWEPRRTRVLAAKLTAAAGGTFLIHVVLLGLLLVVVLPAAWWRGSTAGADGEFWAGVSWSLIRGGTVSALAAVIAAGITVIARYTAAAVTVLLGYGVLGPVLVRSLLRGFMPWDLIENAMAFAKGSDVARFVLADDARSRYWQEVFAHGPGTAFGVVAVYAIAFVVLATVVFQRRDVTPT